MASPATSYSSLSKSNLLALCKKNKIPHKVTFRKDNLVELLLEHDATTNTTTATPEEPKPSKLRSTRVTLNQQHSPPRVPSPTLLKNTKLVTNVPPSQEISPTAVKKHLSTNASIFNSRNAIASSDSRKKLNDGHFEQSESKKKTLVSSIKKEKKGKENIPPNSKEYQDENFQSPTIANKTPEVLALKDLAKELAEMRADIKFLQQSFKDVKKDIASVESKVDVILEQKNLEQTVTSTIKPQLEIIKQKMDAEGYYQQAEFLGMQCGLYTYLNKHFYSFREELDKSFQLRQPEEPTATSAITLEQSSISGGNTLKQAPMTPSRRYNALGSPLRILASPKVSSLKLATPQKTMEHSKNSKIALASQKAGEKKNEHSSSLQLTHTASTSTPLKSPLKRKPPSDFTLSTMKKQAFAKLDEKNKLVEQYMAKNSKAKGFPVGDYILGNNSIYDSAQLAALVDCNKPPIPEEKIPTWIQEYYGAGIPVYTTSSGQVFSLFEDKQFPVFITDRTFRWNNRSEDLKRFWGTLPILRTKNGVIIEDIGK